jgi:GNAT superfamily N-acetyltransferase
MPQGLRIRIAQIEDQKALEAVQWRASLHSPLYREALLANPDAIDLPLDQISAGRVFVAELRGDIAGVAAVLPRADGDTELDGLFVEPKLWRFGVGGALVEHCEFLAAASGATALHVVGNPQAREFYAACGFDITGEHQTRFGPALTLKKKLPVKSEP